MARYYGVRAIIKNGIRVGNIETFRQQHKKIGADEALIGVASNAAFLTASDMTNMNEFERFRKSYSQGHLVAIILYKVKKEDLDKYPDEGRVQVDEFKDPREFYGELLGIAPRNR